MVLAAKFGEGGGHFHLRPIGSQLGLKVAGVLRFTPELPHWRLDCKRKVYGPTRYRVHVGAKRHPNRTNPVLGVWRFAFQPSAETRESRDLSPTVAQLSTVRLRVHRRTVKGHRWPFSPMPQTTGWPTF